MNRAKLDAIADAVANVERRFDRREVHDALVKETKQTGRKMSEEELQRMGENFIKGGMPAEEVFRQIHQYRVQNGMKHPGQK